MLIIGYKYPIACTSIESILGTQDSEFISGNILGKNLLLF